MQSRPEVFSSHPRRWREFSLVYPVISRRSHGLSIGVDLNPDARCTFNCVYCSVAAERPRPPARVDLKRLDVELRSLLDLNAQLFEEPEFRATPGEFRVLRDIAFSGSGEPTVSEVFGPAVDLVAGIREQRRLNDIKLVLITNTCGLHRPEVTKALTVLDAHGGEIWAKLDAGTDEHYQRINRSCFPLSQVLRNIRDTARVRPIVLQSLFLRYGGVGPAPHEVTAYRTRVEELLAAGARFKLIQVYTVARPTPDADATPLEAPALEEIADLLRPLGVPIAVYP